MVQVLQIEKGVQSINKIKNSGKTHVNKNAGVLQCRRELKLLVKEQGSERKKTLFNHRVCNNI